MGRMRWKPAANDIVFITELQDLKGFMCSESIYDQDLWPITCSWLGLEIKDIARLLQHSIAIAVPAGRTSKMPIKCLISRPITSKGKCGLDDERVKTPAINRNTFDRRHQRAFSADFSTFSQITLMQRTLRDVKRFSTIPISSISYTFSGRMAGSYNSFSIKD